MSDTPKLINVYCDESRQSGHRYMVLGGIWIAQEKEIEFNNLCHKFRSQEAHLLSSFLKWGKATSKNFLKLYKQFVDIFFSYPHIKFNAIVIDAHQLDYEKYHQGDKELAFYKFYFLLLSRNMDYRSKHLILLDRRNNKKSGRLLTLKSRLNGYFYNIKQAKHNVAVTVEARDSRLYNQLQLADIFIGYLGYKKDGYTTSPAKLELAKHITYRRTELLPKIKWGKFNVWEWTPQKGYK